MTLQDIDRLTDETVGGLLVESVTVPQGNGYNVLIYGDTGVGKTVLAGSSSVVAEMAPVLFLDIEGGTLSLRHRYPDVRRIRITGFNQMQKIYDDLYTNHEYKTIVVDSLSELQRFSMDKIMLDASNSQRGDKEGFDVDTPAERDWGKNQNQIRYFTRAFRDLPCNVIFTAHAQTRQDQRTGKWKTKPSLPGKLANEISGFLDEVYFMYIKRIRGEGGTVDTRLLLTNATDDEAAKSRLDTLPLVVESPTMAEIFKHIETNTKESAA